MSIPPISCEINIPEEKTTHYRVINGVTFQNTGLEISKLVSILPVPVSNEYQIIENLSVSDGSYHVWNDFYLEKYGWIPVDVTAKNSDLNGDYFGYLSGNGTINSNHFIRIL